MDIKRTEYHFASATGGGEIYARSFVGPGPVRGIFQIAHGMAEHGERYADFAHWLASRGWAVYVIDHAGHGRSAAPAEWGYFGARDGWQAIIADSKHLTDLARQAYPAAPLILFGHSMGSFVARLYAARYGSELAGAIFCGTGGPNPLAGLGLGLARVIARWRGDHYRSPLLNQLAFGTYNRRIPQARTAFDWLNADTANVDRYLADPACGFLLTAAGWRDVLTLLREANAPAWYRRLPPALPLYLIAGLDDPVGNYASGVRQVEERLRQTGHSQVQATYYPGRHEILHEAIRDQVYADIATWCDEVTRSAA